MALREIADGYVDAEILRAEAPLQPGAEDAVEEQPPAESSPEL
jgi:hypothetical protein